ncbi:MAG: hypothetical protein K2K81_03805 [Muribaculaceae bacterium]|nr:hypothetical protein [Muribaculaceae bacterium]
MKFFYFLVDWDGKYSSKLHEFYFEHAGGFTYGILLALVAALILAIVYYFILGRSVTTAKMGNWWICGIFALVVTFLVSDFVIIGQEPTKKEYSHGKELEKKLTYKYSFYRSMDKAVKPGNDTLIKSDMTPGEKQGFTTEKKKIATNLNKGGDVRYTFSVNTTIWCAIFFFIFSMLFKGMSEAAKTKPIKWPY